MRGPASQPGRIGPEVVSLDLAFDEGLRVLSSGELWLRVALLIARGAVVC